MDSRIIFIGGVHGVGKGFVCKQIVAETGLKHLVASNLIKWHEISADEENKLVQNISGTQERLLLALNIICEPSKSYLLDGHYCLLNTDSMPTRVDAEVFEKISPVLFILIHDTALNVKQRLDIRDGRDYPLELLEKMLTEEKKYAEELSFKSGKPLLVVSPDNTEPVLNSIKLLL